MNNYPSWWNTTITLFNKYEDPTTQLISWYKTTIEGCFWSNIHDQVKIGKTVLETDGVICRIRKDEKYLDLENWLALPTDMKDSYFTLGPQDIIIKGEVDDVINEYQSGSRSTDILAKYQRFQRCIEVKQFMDNTGGERGNEHYYVKGV